MNQWSGLGLTRYGCRPLTARVYSQSQLLMIFAWLPTAGREVIKLQQKFTGSFSLRFFDGRFHNNYYFICIYWSPFWLKTIIIIRDCQPKLIHTNLLLVLSNIYKYRHTLGFGLTLVESHLDKLSSWNQLVIAHFLEKVKL